MSTSKLKVGVHHLKIVHFSNKDVGRDMADRIESFAHRNGFEVVVDVKGREDKYTRFELDRRSTSTPFIVINEVGGKYDVGGKIGSKHADLFLEEFCDE